MQASVPLTLHGISKRYGASYALKPTSLHMAAGEMLALLGPSGCGKTTALRLIAGLTAPDAGQILIGDVDATDLPPDKRRLGMVFQDYSLFPHMTVGENIAYGLKIRRIGVAERTQRVRSILELVRLSNFEDRRVSQLSGGQQQRVALARSLVTEPKVLLLDEPLGALDRNLRESMQFELRAIQKRLGITSIIVTHDQEEALTMSDRIAVMSEGEILQTGTPIDIYERPGSQFVSEFLGRVNIFEGEILARDLGGLWIVRLALPNAPMVKVTGPATSSPSPHGRIRVAIRPERLKMNGATETFRATIRDIVFRGSYYAYELDLPGAPKPIYVYCNEPTEICADGTVGLAWPESSALIFAEGSAR